MKKIHQQNYVLVTFLILFIMAFVAKFIIEVVEMCLDAETLSLISNLLVLTLVILLILFLIELSLIFTIRDYKFIEKKVLIFMIVFFLLVFLSLGLPNKEIEEKKNREPVSWILQKLGGRFRRPIFFTIKEI